MVNHTPSRRVLTCAERYAACEALAAQFTQRARQPRRKSLHNFVRWSVKITLPLTDEFVNRQQSVTGDTIGDNKVMDTGDKSGGDNGDMIREKRKTRGATYATTLFYE
jgi:hypothetical protein